MVGFFDTVLAVSDRSGAASLPSLLQRRSQGKLILTPALRESRLANPERTEKKDVYLSPFHVNQLMVCEDKLFGSMPRDMFSWKRRKPSEFNHYYQDSRLCRTI